MYLSSCIQEKLLLLMRILKLWPNLLKLKSTTSVSCIVVFPSIVDFRDPGNIHLQGKNMLHGKIYSLHIHNSETSQI